MSLTPMNAHSRSATANTKTTTTGAASLAPSHASKTSWFSTRSGKGPVVEANGLSITERFFFNTPVQKQQVLMCIMVRVRLPPAAKATTAQRIVDLVRIAQAKHYRLSSWIDHETMGVVPFGDYASELPTNYRLFEREGENWLDVYMDEINANFDANDVTKPLWRTAIILPKQWMPSQDSDVHQKPYPILYNRESKPIIGYSLPPPVGESYFDIMFTFHHCLGDGLSMLAFARTFLECVDATHFNGDDLGLDKVEVSKEPPPVLDNLFNPNVLEVLPTAASMAIKAFAKKKKRLGHTGDSLEQINKNETTNNQISNMPTPTIESTNKTPSISPLSKTMPLPPITISAPKPRGLTNARFLWFNSEFTNILRKRGKQEKTTMAAVLVVAGLTACRSVFTYMAKRDGKDLRKEVPNSQGWVVTNSIRWILPQSKLIQGGDRETDEGLKVFGGYAGSVSNNNLRLTNESNIWDRCRNVKRGIATSMRSSIQRMKVANYAYRHPKLWQMAEKRIDLAKLSRSFSVEVANLGAWEYPSAAPDAPASDERGRLDFFGGALNSSFDGARGLFSCGIITLGGNMSVCITYDVRSVQTDEAEVFFEAYIECLKRLSEAKSKATVGEMMV